MPTPRKSVIHHIRNTRSYRMFVDRPDLTSEPITQYLDNKDISKYLNSINIYRRDLKKLSKHLE